ncbi:phage major capsid protein [Pseudomonas carnis]|uniref:Phage major capsid protein n=3 Tax=Pseudomonas TaxID=286 RepID=A0A5P1DD84_9PSED|nr:MULTISPECIES: phage major capsid protein [Pseudomonas]AMS20663.1 capsid protein [Pseudomonas synxantha]EIK68953.1 phage major capsid protein, HK97 family [Pseudomonas synxantha BG33R]MBA1253552.1 phage major capsid protein [Pseudomonas carnis]MBA1267656.1 phage major capsid protein [Pseudomonas carnis]MBA1299387.1 phage major capsid protein [Pseudomonas carnis]
MTDPIQEVKSSLENQLKEGFGGLQKKYDAVADELQKGNTVTAEMKSQIENQKGEIERVIEQVQKLEEKGIKLRNQNPEKKSFIDFVKGNDNYQALTKKTQSSAEIEITKSDMASMAEVKVTSAGLVAPQYDPVIQGAPRQNLLIRDLIPTTPVTGQAFTYYRELLHTLGAGMVPEGGAKPTSNVTFEQVTDTIKKIAVWMPVTDEALDDVPQLYSYIQELLRFDLELKREGQLLKGDGTGNNLNGIMTQATVFDPALSKATDTAIDTVRRAIYQARKQSKLPADAVVMSDLDWMNIELQKDGENRYLFANLQGLVTPVLWGRPIVASDSMDEGDGETTGGEFLTGSFQQGARIYDRMGFTIKVGMINDDFIKNQRAILVEERLGLAVRKKYAFVKGRFKHVA